MDELPDFLFLLANDPEVRKQVVDLFKNKQFADSVASVLQDPERGNFFVSIGDDETLKTMPERLRRKVKKNKNLGGFTGFGGDKSAHGAFVFALPSRLPKEVRQDSLLNSQVIRDALIHEFAHVLPVAKTRNPKDRIRDPKPGSPGEAQSEILQAENALRGLLGLPAKAFYGLLAEDRR